MALGYWLSALGSWLKPGGVWHLDKDSEYAMSVV